MFFLKAIQYQMYKPTSKTNEYKGQRPVADWTDTEVGYTMRRLTVRRLDETVRRDGCRQSSARSLTAQTWAQTKLARGRLA